MAGLFRFLLTAAALPALSFFLEGITLLDWPGALLLGAGMAVIYLLLHPLMRALLPTLRFPVYAAIYILVDAWLMRTGVNVLPKSVSIQGFPQALAASALLNAARFLTEYAAGDYRT